MRLLGILFLCLFLASTLACGGAADNTEAAATAPPSAAAADADDADAETEAEAASSDAPTEGESKIDADVESSPFGEEEPTHAAREGADSTASDG